MTERLTKEQVNYRAADDPVRRCGLCSMYRAPDLAHGFWGRCTLVEGQIGRNDVCDRWAPMQQTRGPFRR